MQSVKAKKNLSRCPFQIEVYYSNYGHLLGWKLYTYKKWRVTPPASLIPDLQSKKTFVSVIC